MNTRAEAERPSSFAQQVLDALARCVSRPTARSLLDLALRRQSIPMAAFGPKDLDAVGRHLRDGLALFASTPSQIVDCMNALDRLAGGAPLSPEPNERIQVVLRAEEDIVKARIEARAIALRAGFSEIARTRVATAVSELARNIVRYAGEGTISVSTVQDAHGDRLVEIVASDRGPGIADLPSVLGGTYRSQHGMGLGLRGVKRIAQHFDVQTAPQRGTRIQVRMGGNA